MTNPSPLCEIATLAGGCFWCIEAVFADLKGVIKASSGYMGGNTSHPSYEEVCTGQTGHAEVVQVEFDLAEISYQELLEVFFHVHNPTELNRQGNDIGTQYRSEIFYHSSSQAQQAKAAIDRYQADWSNPIVTKVTKATEFWLAEAYHHDYFLNNPNQAYCAAVVGPKVSKFRQKYRSRLKSYSAD